MIKRCEQLTNAALENLNQSLKTLTALEDITLRFDSYMIFLLNFNQFLMKAAHRYLTQGYKQ